MLADNALWRTVNLHLGLWPKSPHLSWAKSREFWPLRTLTDALFSFWRLCFTFFFFSQRAAADLLEHHHHHHHLVLPAMLTSVGFSTST
jgi:hypothetical protein